MLSIFASFIKLNINLDSEKVNFITDSAIWNQNVIDNSNIYENQLHFKNNIQNKRIKLVDSDIIEIVDVLILSNLHATLQSLSLPNHDITSIGLEYILNKLGAYIQDLDVSYNNIQDLSFLLQFSGKCSLHQLNLSFNPLGRVGGMQLGELLSIESLSSVKLKKLKINSCDLDLTSLIFLMSSMNENNYLEVIELNRPLNITSKREEILSHLNRVLLNPINSISSISLKYHQIKDDGMIMLSDAISRNLNVKELYLDSNQITESGASALASSLIIQERLQSNKRNNVSIVSLSYNMIGSEGAIAFAQLVRTSTSLKKLYLKNNSIHSEGLIALIKSLLEAKSLTELQIFGNDFDQSASKTLYEILQLENISTRIKLDVKIYIVDGQYMVAESN